MSQRRHLRRLAARADFVPLSKDPENAAHGCAVCRGDVFREHVARDMIAQGRVTEAVRCVCRTCAGSWIVELFAFGPEQELRIAFKAENRKAPN